MGKRGLYPNLSTKKSNNDVRIMMNILSMCDGNLSLIQIAEILNVPIWELYDSIKTLESHDLIKEID